MQTLEINLTLGQPYLVKHHGGKQYVRRVYRGEETGVMDMKRLVFSAKVKKGVFAIVDAVKDKEGKETGVEFWHWKNTSNVPAQEISIPWYDVKDIKPATN